MAYTVTINYGSGDVVLTNYSGENLVYAGSLKKTTQVHSKDFRPVSGQAWFSIQPKPALMSALFALDRDQLITVEILDGASAWFTGYVRPLTKFKDSTGKKSVEFECVDAGWILHLKPSTDVQFEPADAMVVCDTSSTSNSLIHQILDAAGFTGSITAFDIDESIDYLRIVNKPYFEVLSDLCFSYHTSFYFDESGGFVLYDWGVESGDISSSGTLDEGDMVNDLSINRETQIADTPVVRYFQQIESPGSFRSSFSPSLIISYGWWIGYYGSTIYWRSPQGSHGLLPVELTDTIDIRHPDLGDDVDGVISSNAKITILEIGGIYVTPDPNEITNPTTRKTFVYPLTETPTQYTANTTFRVTVSGDSMTAKIVPVFPYTSSTLISGLYAPHAWRVETIEVTSNLVVSSEAGRVTGPDVGPGTKDYVARYCYDATLAEGLATAISENLKYGEYLYTWSSEDSYDVGDYYIVSNTEASVSGTVRITKKSENVDQNGIVIYQYEGRRYSGFSAVTVTADPGLQVNPIIITEDEEGEIISGSGISEIGDEPLPESGLYLARDKMGYYDATAEEWKAVINNDGTFKFDGDGSSYIEWDGSSLSIRGDLVINGEVEAGDDVQSSNYVAGASGWIITGNGDAEFNTLTVRDEDIQDALVGEVPVDIADFECAVPWWMRVMKLDGTGYTTDFQKTYTAAATYSSAQTNRHGMSLFPTSGTSKYELAYLPVIKLTGTNKITGMAIWCYVDSLSNTTEYPIAKLSSSSAGYSYSLELKTSGAVTVFVSTLSPDSECATSTATVTVDAWNYISCWYNATNNTMTISVNGTEKTVNVSSFTGWGTPWFDRLYAYGYSGYDQLTVYSSEASVINITDGTNPSATIEAYRTSTAPWSERFKPHAFNVATEINSGQALLPPGWIWGLETAEATDTDHDVTISPGKARDALDRWNIILDNPITKRIDATWAAGSAAGGLFSGSVAASTSYHLFVIRKDSDGSVDAGWDTSVTAVNRPAAYTAYRRIRSYRTDASANLIQTVQNGDEFILKTPINNVNTASPGTSRNTVSVSTPSGIVVNAALLGVLLNTDTSYVSFNPTSGTDYIPDVNTAQISTTSGAPRSVNSFKCLTNTSSQITYRCTDGTLSTAIVLTTFGWTDTRGRFGEV